MSRDRIDVQALTVARFAPPAGCQPEEVIASWWRAQQIVTCEHRRKVAAPTRATCQALLENEKLSDTEVLEAVRKVLKRHGW